MPIKDSLLRRGYFPEDLPPPFTSTFIANYFIANPPRNYLMRVRDRLRAASYNASKRGMTRRMFSAIHPVTAHDTSEFLAQRWEMLTDFFEQTHVSFSTPLYREGADRALIINSHAALEREKINRLSSYRFIAVTDISRFYHSIYTHSIPWAYHGKAKSKSDTTYNSQQTFFNRADAIIRNGQDGQTIGLPVGPDLEIAERVVRSCGALTLVALLHSANGGFADREVFSIALQRLDNENDSGKYWPVFLEWNAREWPQYRRVALDNTTMKSLSDSHAHMYDQTILPTVFQDIAEEDIASVAFAIEPRPSIYGDEFEDEGEEEDGIELF